VLAQSAERHWSHIRRIMGATLSQVGARAAIWDEHERMLEAILEGDDRAAQQLALHHCENAGQTLVARVSSLAEPDKQHA
jgi:DNA-binding GntR family transcriptional regulator